MQHERLHAMCGQVFNCTQLKGLSRVDQVSLSRIQCSHQPGLGLWKVVELRIYKAGNAKLSQKTHNIFFLTTIGVQQNQINLLERPPYPMPLTGTLEIQRIRTPTFTGDALMRQT